MCAHANEKVTPNNAINIRNVTTFNGNPKPSTALKFIAVSYSIMTAIAIDVRARITVRSRDTVISQHRLDKYPTHIDQQPDHDHDLGPVHPDTEF